MLITAGHSCCYFLKVTIPIMDILIALLKKKHKDRERYKFKCNFLKEYNEIPENYNPQIFDLRINTTSETVVGVTH